MIAMLWIMMIVTTMKMMMMVLVEMIISMLVMMNIISITVVTVMITIFFTKQINQFTPGRKIHPLEPDYRTFSCR